MAIYGRQLNAVEVGNPETLLTNANKPASFSRRCTAASACVVWGVKGDSNGEPKRSENHCHYGEWKMFSAFIRTWL